MAADAVCFGRRQTIEYSAAEWTEPSYTRLCFLFSVYVTTRYAVVCFVLRGYRVQGAVGVTIHIIFKINDRTESLISFILSGTRYSGELFIKQVPSTKPTDLYTEMNEWHPSHKRVLARHLPQRPGRVMKCVRRASLTLTKGTGTTKRKKLLIVRVNDDGGVSVLN